MQSSICINLHYYLFIFMRFFCFLKELKRNSLKICSKWVGKRKMKVKRHSLKDSVCIYFTEFRVFSVFMRPLQTHADTDTHLLSPSSHELAVVKFTRSNTIHLHLAMQHFSTYSLSRFRFRPHPTP